jgi:hypothetical protein
MGLKAVDNSEYGDTKGRRNGQLHSGNGKKPCRSATQFKKGNRGPRGLERKGQGKGVPKPYGFQVPTSFAPQDEPRYEKDANARQHRVL